MWIFGNVYKVSNSPPVISVTNSPINPQDTGSKVQREERRYRLPADVYCVYARNKKDIKAIIQWVIPHGPPKGQAFMDPVGQDTKQLADVVSKQELRTFKATTSHLKATVNTPGQLNIHITFTPVTDSQKVPISEKLILSFEANIFPNGRRIRTFRTQCHKILRRSSQTQAKASPQNWLLGNSHLQQAMPPA